MTLSENAVKVLEKRYLAKDEAGKLIENPEGMFRRVAKTVAAADRGYVSDSELKGIEDMFYDMMSNLEFLPNSPTLMNAGRPLGQLSACFVLPIEDTMEGIFESIKHAALIHKSGGGTGFSFSRLRPAGASVNSTGGVASGPVSFMKVFNSATEAVKQGGTRRGANMGILRVDHPDIRQFITCKQDNKDITNFNISIAITEEFMEAVAKDTPYDLIDPKSGRAVGQENAKEIFSMMIDNAWNNGEPGIIFLDRVNRDNATPELGDIESTNPCFHPDTRISTEEGLVTVKELFEKHNNESFHIYVDNRVTGEKLQLNGRSYYKNGISLKPARVFMTGTKQTYKVILKNGQELKVTGDHRIFTTRGWKEAKTLNENDIVLVQSGAASFAKEDSIGRDLGLFLGWVTGDGWLTAARDVVGLTFAGNEYYICEALKAFQRENGTWNLMFKKKEFIEKVTSIGLKGVRAPEKRVPGGIFTASKETVIAYLNGLFSSDGTVNYVDENHRDVRLSSASKQLLQDVQLLLLHLGVFSSIYKREKGGTYHDLIITGDDMVTFADTVGNLIHTAKNAKLKRAARTSRKKTKFISSVESIIEDEITEVYDINEADTHSLIAQGLVVHNCGEQPLLPYEACNLGSVNLSLMVRNNEGKPDVDYDRLKDVVAKAVHFLDNVIDVNKYPLPQIDQMTKGTRKIGLGVMGWADLLCKLGIPYNSLIALGLAEKVMSFIQSESKKASEEIASRKGVFPMYDKSIYKDSGIRLRNATTTTIAPTGTLSIIAGASSGIEPLFAVSFIRNVMDNDELVEANPLFKEIAVLDGFYSDSLIKRIAVKGTVRDFPEVPRDIQEVFVTAHDIPPEWHVRMQAAFQKHTDNAVSKTVNLSHDASKEDVAAVFDLAYRTNCKGVTIYRDGSREAQVLNIGKVNAKESDAAAGSGSLEYIAPRIRPEITMGFTEKVRTGCGTLFITVNYDEYGICEVFTNLGKGGGCPSQSEATSRLVSIAIRSGMDPKSLVEQLKGIRCISTIKQKGLNVMSCPDAIGRVIEKVMKLQNGNGHSQHEAEYTALSGETAASRAAAAVADIVESAGAAGWEPASKCPECGRDVEHESGCIICRNCGYSKCG